MDNDRDTESESPIVADEVIAESSPESTPESDAPWGRKADGTPRKRPGRPPKSTAGSVATESVTESAPAKPPKAPRAPRPSASDEPARALAEVVQAETTSGSWFSAEADAQRCERARHAARHWLDASRFAVATGEEIARVQIAKSLHANGHSSESIERTLRKMPRFREVPMEFGGSKTDCETVNAQALAFLAGYFVPMTPDHPLAQAGIAVVSSFVAYRRALEQALANDAR